MNELLSSLLFFFSFCKISLVEKLKLDEVKEAEMEGIFFEEVAES